MSEISNPMQELEIPSAAIMREKVDSYWADDCKAVLNETADALRLICSQIEASADRGNDLLVVNVEQEFNKNLVITCLYRSPEENAALYKGAIEPKWRPHTLWCGADLRSSIYTQDEIQKLLSFLNHFTVFSGQRKCASYHAIAGNVHHFHVQCEKAEACPSKVSQAA